MDLLHLLKIIYKEALISLILIIINMKFSSIIAITALLSECEAMRFKELTMQPISLLDKPPSMEKKQDAIMILEKIKQLIDQ